MLKKIVTTEDEVMFLDPARIVKMVPCGAGDYNVFLEGEGGDRRAWVTFTISGREAEKLASSDINGP